MTTYYVDFENGASEHNGLSASSPREDYQTLDLHPGDRVLFKRGSFVRGPLHAQKHVTYGAYGVGPLPTFCGSLDVSAPECWISTNREGVWQCVVPMDGDVGNLVFNDGDCTAALKWEMDGLTVQGDFYSEPNPHQPGKTLLYLYSVIHPSLFYTHLEAVPYATRHLVNLDEGMTFEDLRLINSGVHGMAGHGNHITVRRCVFENIGGCPWNRERRIRFGNGFEIWEMGNDILIEDCSFRNIYDSCVTHQGPGADTEPAHRFVCRNNAFDTYGMAAFEYRDKLPVDSTFEGNTCQNAGSGFAMLGETLPRRSEIWPQPMGHHVFLWRIPEVGGEESLSIRNNTFGPAPVGAAIYSIISPEAEARIDLSGNRYTKNPVLLYFFGGKAYSDLSEFARETGKDRDGTYLD